MATTFSGFWLGSPLTAESRAVTGTGVVWKCAALEIVLASAVGVNVPCIFAQMHELRGNQQTYRRHSCGPFRLIGPLCRTVRDSSFSPHSSQLFLCHPLRC